MKTQLTQVNGSSAISLGSDNVLTLSNADFRTAYVEVPFNGAEISRITMDMLVEQPTTASKRAKSPGLFLRFGSRYQYVVFSNDDQRIQYGGTDGHNYGGLSFSPNTWYRIELLLNYDSILINYYSANGNHLMGPMKVNLASDALSQWHGQGVLQFGLFDDVAAGGAPTSIRVANLQMVSPTDENSSGGTGAEGKLSLEAAWKSRKAYTRDEDPQELKVALRSLSSQSSTADIKFLIDGGQIAHLADQTLPASGEKILTIPFDPEAFPAGLWDLEIYAGNKAGDVVRLALPLRIVEKESRQLPYMSWNAFDKEIQHDAWEHGFTMIKAWSSEMRAPSLEDLDIALFNGLRHGGHFGSTTYNYLRYKTPPQAAYVKHADGSVSDKINHFYKDYIEFSAQTAADKVKPVANHPGMSNLLLNTEKKEGPLPYNSDTLAAARAAGALKSNENIPQGFDKGDVPSLDLNHSSVERPSRGLISDDNIHYRFFKWWKAEGGYQPVHTAIYNAVKAIAPQVDITVEFAQKHSDYLEFWFRTVNDAENDPVFYNGHLTDMIYSARKFGHKISALFQFVSSESPYSADLFRESAWIILSRNPERMGHWGANRGFKNDKEAMNKYAEQRAELKRLHHEVFQPLFPLLRTLERPRHNVAFLKSEANWLYHGKDAGKIMHDWRSSVFFKYRERALTLAGVAWEPVHDDDVFNGALSQYEAVVVLHTKVLPRGVYDRLKQFVANGGKLFVDKKFESSFDPIPGMIVMNPDFSLIDTASRWWATEADDQIIEDYRRAGDHIRSHFNNNGVYAYARADSSSVVVNWLEGGDGKYVFVVNDLRTDSTQHARGIAQTVPLRLRESRDVHITDVLTGESIAWERVNGQEIIINLPVGPADGRLLAVLPRKVEAIELNIPASLSPGQKVTISGKLVSGGAPVPTDRLVYVQLKDRNGLLNAGGYYAVENGVINLPMTVPYSTDGALSVTIADIASSVTKTVESALPASGHGSIWESAAPKIEGWTFSDWFGWLFEDADNWVYHETLGWMVYQGQSLSNIWFYRPTQGWFWTNQDSFPFLWDSSTGQWHYYWIGTYPACFSNLATGEVWWN